MSARTGSALLVSKNRMVVFSRTIPEVDRARAHIYTTTTTTTTHPESTELSMLTNRSVSFSRTKNKRENLTKAALS